MPFLEREHVSVCLSTSPSAVAYCEGEKNKNKNHKSTRRCRMLLCVLLKWISVSGDVSIVTPSLFSERLQLATVLSFLHNSPFLL